MLPELSPSQFVFQANGFADKLFAFDLQMKGALFDCEKY
jgi:hypothetical protein